jgi:hypothetical protein
LNLLRQYTPWAVKMSSHHHNTCSIFILIFQTTGKMLCFSIFKNSRSCTPYFRPTYHANTYQGGLYTIMPYIGLCARTRVLSCKLLQPPHRNSEM